VVACLVHGARWQFRGWGFAGADRGDLVETFDRLAGFYLRYADETTPPDVRGWNCKVLVLQRAARYEDAALVRDLWATVDEHCRLRPGLLSRVRL